MKKVAIAGISIAAMLGIAIATYLVLPVEKPVHQEISPTIVQRQELPKQPAVDELLALVNEERAKVGVAPLVIDVRFNKSAQIKADDMTTHGYFEHADMNGKHGYEYIFENAPGLCRYGGENLSRPLPDFSAKSAVDGWKLSTAHYAAMVDPKYSLTGFGISSNRIVQHFCQT